MHWLHGMQRALSRLALALLALIALAPAHSQSVQAALGSKTASSAVVTTEQVRAELLAHAPQGIGPGRSVWLGLRLTHQDGWHTYWKNPGDSGLPTTLQWTLPASVQAGEIAWPTPKKFPLGDLANYGYEGAVLLPVPLQVDANFGAERLELRLQASWLVCRRECIPQDGQFVLSLPTQSSTASHGPAFEAALAAQPRALAAGDSRIEVREQALQIVLAGLPAEARGRTLELFAETAAIIEPAGAWKQAWEGPLWKAQVPLAKLRSDSPGRLPLVVALPDGGAWRLELPVNGPWPPPAAAAALTPALEAALKAAAQEAAQRPPKRDDAMAGWWLALLGALLGGLILNLMPCVFPVLAIKALGFSQQRGDRLQQGLAYTAGVLLSFVALGALLLALRAGGQQLGWGFQLQNPAIVAALAILFTLIGLNLAGLFEFTQMAPGRLAALQWRHPAADAALSGVLAVAIASPCTAPFMGASLGAALSLPAWQGLAIFAMLGLGMALPYLLISAVPALGRALPRPGPWMLRLKQVMAFPMLATVIWLLWVLGQQSGIDGVAALMVVLLLMALLLWTLGLSGPGRRIGAALALLTLALGLGWAAPQVVREAQGPTPAAAGSQESWQAWRPGLVKELTAQGRPVLVDFTAAWCITCQYNKQTVLNDPAVLTDAQARQVALLRADWTRRDSAVTAALAELGRAGVPVYALYAPGRPPVLLSEILSVSELRQALSRL